MSRRFRHSHALIIFAILVASCSIVPPAIAVMPDEILADPLQEARARHLGSSLRCVVCQNQSIDDSSAPLARDLRLLLRERLQLGETDEQVVAFLTHRYGHFILLNPPLLAHTLLLWLGPALMLVAGSIGLGLHLLRRHDIATGEDVALELVSANDTNGG